MEENEDTEKRSLEQVTLRKINNQFKRHLFLIQLIWYFKLNDVIKDVVKSKYKAVEAAWNHVDVTNENQMNKDIMFRFFKKSVTQFESLSKEEF